MRYRVWWYEEFKGFKSDEERDDMAWEVPPERGIFNRDVITECDDVEEAAEKYADYFHSDRDGWENTWPIEFVVHDGEKYYLVSVDRDMEPVFSSSKPAVLQESR